MFIFQFHRLFIFHLTQWMFRPITAKECYGWQSRRGGVQRLPFNCEERVLCGISIFFLSAFYFLSLPLQESPVISHANFLFLHCPPLLHWLFFLHSHPHVTCHLPHPLLFTLLPCFPSHWNSPPTDFLSSIHSHALPKGFAMVTGRMDEWQGQKLLRSSSLKQHRQTGGRPL